DTDAVAITVIAVNDAPVNTVPATASTNEDTALVFSSGNSNQISVADVDAASGTVQVTLSSTYGPISLGSTTGLSFSFSDANGTGAGDGTTDTTMTFRGTLAQVNAALATVTYYPNLNYNGPASLSMTSNDLGNTGSGGAKTDTDAVAITVIAVNDAPVNTVPATASTNEDTALVFSSGNSNQISVADVDAASGTVQVTLSSTYGPISLGS